MRKLDTLKINNFKSIREQTLKLGSLNVFIGGNGSGKSNFIEVFRLLREIVNQNLAGYTALKGGADTLLYFGRKQSPEMEIYLEFGKGETSNAYKVKIRGTDEDSLIIWDERAYYHEKKKYPKPYDIQVSSFSKESKLKQINHICARQVIEDLNSYRVYHFHDTSDTAAAKRTCDVADNRFLKHKHRISQLFFIGFKKKNQTILQL